MANEQSQYFIESAILSTTRKKNGGCLSLDIANIIAELHLFEDIRLPFVTGIVMVSDSENVLDILGFTGTEKLALTVTSTVSTKKPSVSKKFFIKSVAATDRDKTMYVFTIVEEHGFFWATTHINHGYSGKIENIISTLFAEWMQKQVDTSFAEESVQNEIVYSCANHSLMQIIPQLTWSMCTDKGFPYFVYGTLFDTDIQLISLDDLWDREPFNCQPFVYAPTYMQSVIEQGNKEAEYYNIISYDPNQNLSDYFLYQSGMLNVKAESIDVDDGTREEVKVDPKSISDVIDLLTGKETGTGNQFLYNPDEELEMNGVRVLDTLSDNPVHLKFSNQAMNGQFTLAEKDKKSAVGGVAVEKLWALSIRLRTGLNNVMIPILVPGAAFFEAQASVGSTINLMFAKLDENKQEERGAPEDKRLSGKYIITNIKHMFIEEKHMAQLIVAKFDEEK